MQSERKSHIKAIVGFEPTIDKKKQISGAHDLTPQPCMLRATLVKNIHLTLISKDGRGFVASLLIRNY